MALWDVSMDHELRLLIVDDHTLLRQVLQAALAHHPLLQVVGQAATARTPWRRRGAWRPTSWCSTSACPTWTASR